MLVFIFCWNSKDVEYSILLNGGFSHLRVCVCGRNEMVFESLKVLRAVMMAGSYEDFRCSDTGKLVYRALLREARVREAEDLREALEGNEAKNVLLLIDRIIEDWTV